MADDQITGSCLPAAPMKEGSLVLQVQLQCADIDSCTEEEIQKFLRRQRAGDAIQFDPTYVRGREDDKKQ